MTASSNLSIRIFLSRPFAARRAGLRLIKGKASNIIALGALAAGLAVAASSQAAPYLLPQSAASQTLVVQVAGSESDGLAKLKARGATIIDDAKIKGIIDGGRAKHGGVACVGVSQCTILIDNFGDQCDDFRCGSDGGKPVCWCDT